MRKIDEETQKHPKILNRKLHYKIEDQIDLYDMQNIIDYLISIGVVQAEWAGTEGKVLNIGYYFSPLGRTVLKFLQIAWEESIEVD